MQYSVFKYGTFKILLYIYKNIYKREYQIEVFF